MKTKKLSLVILILALIVLSISAYTAVATTTDYVDISITSINKVSVDAMNRYQLFLQTDYSGSLFNNAQNPSTRTNSTSIDLSMNIDGKEFTYETGKYVVSFGQNLGSLGELFIVLKSESGNVSGTTAEFYPSDYPGMAIGEKHVITMSKGTLIGAFRLSNDFAIIIPENTTNSFLVSNPQVVTIEGGTISSGTYEYQSLVQANAGSKVSFTPTLTPGKILDKIVLEKTDGTPADITVQESNGVYSFTMPEHEVKIKITEKEMTYALTCGNTVVHVKPYDKIGELPEGVWFVDGMEISKNSTYVWTEDKTATLNTGDIAVFVLDGEVIWKQHYDKTKNGSDVRFPSLPAKQGYTASWDDVEFNGGTKIINAKYTLIEYTVTFKVDGQIYETVKFNYETESVSLPPIPIKDGYTIVGWDITSLPASDVTVNAIYQKIN